jgi:predicted ATPase
MNGTATLKQFESFRLDRLNECLWLNATKVPLPPKPFAVLRYLVENPARLVTHDELLDALWPETYVQPQVLRTYILELRKVLGDDAGQPRFIQTLPKRGYCFVAQVTDVSATQCGALGVSPSAVVSTGLVGREKELAQLSAEMQQLSQSQRRMVFITGEAGIGKSALVEAFSRHHETLPALSVARGQCVEGFGAKEEYYPVMEALGQLCALPAGARAREVLSSMAPAWLVNSGQSHEASISLPKAPALVRMPGDLCAALEELSADQPLVLIFEDINWADEGTLRLISALARRRAPAKLLLLATYRPQAVAPEHPLKALKQDLQMRHLCAEIALQPLAKDHVRELLAKQLQQPALPPGLTSFVHQYSEGNPLFAIALLEHLLAERCIVCESSDGTRIWKQRTPFEEMEDRVPTGLAQMIELEIDCLPQEQQRLLEAGSLMGNAFPAWAVAAVLKKDTEEIEEACDALVHKLYFLDEAGHDELPHGMRSAFYMFAHGLYRDVLYRRQSASRRARWHTRIAERLAELFHGNASNVAREIAFHYEAATDWQRAIVALRSAAQQAVQRQAYAEAENLLEHTHRLAKNLPTGESESAVQEVQRELLAVREALGVSGDSVAMQPA